MGCRVRGSTYKGNWNKRFLAVAGEGSRIEKENKIICQKMLDILPQCHVYCNREVTLCQIGGKRMEENTYTVIVGKQGRIVLPSKLREEHEIREGDVIKIVSNGAGHKIEVTVLHK